MSLWQAERRPNDSMVQHLCDRRSSSQCLICLLAARGDFAGAAEKTEQRQGLCAAPAPISCADLGGRSEGMNRQQAALVVAGSLIAAAITLANHWTGDAPTALRMDRWTGRVLFCEGFREPGPGWIMSCPVEALSNRLETWAR
jgi:hypothetical protein